MTISWERISRRKAKHDFVRFTENECLDRVSVDTFFYTYIIQLSLDIVLKS